MNNIPLTFVRESVCEQQRLKWLKTTIQ